MVLLAVGGHAAEASDWGPLQGPYDEPNSHGVDVLASGIALLPMLAVAGACGLVVLPADLLHEARNPADEFGKASEAVCMAPAAALGLGVYLVGGFPFYALKKSLWDFPRSLIHGDPKGDADDGVVTRRPRMERVARASTYY